MLADDSLALRECVHDGESKWLWGDRRVSQEADLKDGSRTGGFPPEGVVSASEFICQDSSIHRLKMPDHVFR